MPELFLCAIYAEIGSVETECVSACFISSVLSYLKAVLDILYGF